eukprot:CAMPEP_0114228674 /NCGR_PEP_ID=MMETSP0058-20121206/2477_1 /TAXON_ID=36894 /ORGANISM="Pyramimonas parkeae, CCMP726" /LENGTH=97 /DNA_ID=CAMNT_0001339653 /DNA_START=192 /DNA_END=485 /DNA_ORIENTATION=+
MPDIDEQWVWVVHGIPGLRQKTMKSWIIRDSKEEKMLLERSTSTRGCRTQDVHLATYDFTSMHTTLLDLKDRLDNLLDSIYQHSLQTSDRHTFRDRP